MDDPERHRFDLKPTKKVNWRFGIVDIEGRRSGTFKVWTSFAAHQSQADIYIAGRSMGGALKASLHASGARQVGLTSDHVKSRPLPEGKTRHYDRWMQPQSEAGTIEYLIRFPTDHLRLMPPAAKKGGCRVAASGAGGGTAELCLFVSTPTDHLRIDFKGTAPVAMAKLSDGRFLVIVYRLVDAVRLTNQDALSADLAKFYATVPLESTHRLLVGFVDGATRGWIDFSAEQYLADVRATPQN